MSATLEIAPASAGDAAEVIALWQAAGLTRPWNDPDKDINFARSCDNAILLVGELGGQIACSVMTGHDGHRGTVYYVAVAPAHRNKGLGRQVMAAAEEWLKQQGVWKLNLLVRADNEQACGFYRRLGYEVEPRLCMARKLLP